MNNVDKVSPFHSAMVVAYCDIDNADVTRTFTSYIDTIKYLYRNCELIGCSKAELEELQARTRNFKTGGRKPLPRYQASAVGTQKFHALEYFADT